MAYEPNGRMSIRCVRFIPDGRLPRMLHCRLLRSTQPHARIVRVDTARAAQVNGVHLVLTGETFPISYGILPVSHDEHALCRDKVRFVGDPVAAVIAQDETTADLAVNLIDVEYEPLRTFAAPADSLAHPEPRIHDYGDHGNVHKTISMTFGDVEGGFAAADEIFEDLYYYEGNTHLPMEQHAAVAVPEEMPGSVRLTCAAGSAYLFHGNLVHCPGNNRGPTARRVILFNFGHRWMRMWKGHEPSTWLAGQAVTPIRRQLLGLAPDDLAEARRRAAG